MKDKNHLPRIITFRQICEHFGTDFELTSNVIARTVIPPSYVVMEEGKPEKKYRIEILDYLKGTL